MTLGRPLTLNSATWEVLFSSPGEVRALSLILQQAVDDLIRRLLRHAAVRKPADQPSWSAAG